MADQEPIPNPAEVAQLLVNGQYFEDWETVWVQQRWMEGYDLFRFTASERADLPTAWTSLQFKPGDQCQILLGGQLALSGIILKRQTAYDANSHAVELSGVSRTWGANTSSVPTKINNFDNMPLTPIAQKLMGFYGVNVVPVGTVDETPFDRMQAQPGELVFDFLDKLARHRGAVLGTDSDGNFLLIGEHTKPVVQQLLEGENIKKMQCIIYNEDMASIYSVMGQKAATDGDSGKAASEMQAQTAGSLTSIFKFLETVVEQPVKTQIELEMRATYEALQREGTLINATVTVQGWLRDGNALWKPGDNVFVYSPMALLNLVLKIQSATFSQDEQRGTITELELVLPWKLRDPIYSTNPDKTAPQPPEPATTTSGQPAAPPQPPPPPQTQSTNPMAPNYVPAPPISK
jgi:prophage tail gpP-like protein